MDKPRKPRSTLCRRWFAFYNTSKYDVKTLSASLSTRQETSSLLNGFSNTMSDVLREVSTSRYHQQLDTATLLFKVMQRFAEADLSPASIPNHQMGTVFGVAHPEVSTRRSTRTPAITSLPRGDPPQVSRFSPRRHDLEEGGCPHGV